MDKKKIAIVGLVVIIAIFACLIASQTILKEKPDNVVRIEHITFNTSYESNVTNFTLAGNDSGWAGYTNHYLDANKIGYNVYIRNGSGIGDRWDEWISWYKDDKGYADTPKQTVNGVVIYTKSASSGEHVGEPRYVSYVENSDLHTVVEFWSPNPNETAKMTLSLKFD